MEDAREKLATQVQKEFPIGAIFDFEYHQSFIRGEVESAGLNWDGFPRVNFKNLKSGAVLQFGPTYSQSILVRNAENQLKPSN